MNDSTVPVDIGADYADNYDMDGFISNVRIVKGTALYTQDSHHQQHHSLM